MFFPIHAMGMFMMPLCLFDADSPQPTDDDLVAALGRSKKAWDDLVGHISRTYAPVEEEWKIAVKKWGWSMRLKQKKRNILYLRPCRRYFQCTVVLGDRAVAAALEIDLPEDVSREITEATRYVEGTPIRFEIRKKDDIKAIRKLVAIKMAPG